MIGKSKISVHRVMINELYLFNTLHGDGTRLFPTRFQLLLAHSLHIRQQNSSHRPKCLKKKFFEIYVADRKATTCI